MLVALLLHDATALWDVGYAVSRWDVTPVVQLIHSFVEMVEAAASLSYPLCRGGDARVAGYVATMASMQVVLEWLPYLEEFARTTRARRQPSTSAGLPANGTKALRRPVARRSLL